MIVTYTKAGKVVTESEALDADGRLLDGVAKHVRQPVILRDGMPVKDSAPAADTPGLEMFDATDRDEVAVVFDALRSDDADRLDWGRLEANRRAAVERGRGNAPAARVLEAARDEASARLRDRPPAKSDEPYQAYRRTIGLAWNKRDDT